MREARVESQGMEMERRRAVWPMVAVCGCGCVGERCENGAGGGGEEGGEGKGVREGGRWEVRSERLGRERVSFGATNAVHRAMLDSRRRRGWQLYTVLSEQTCSGHFSLLKQSKTQLQHCRTQARRVAWLLTRLLPTEALLYLESRAALQPLRRDQLGSADVQMPHAAVDLNYAPLADVRNP